MIATVLIALALAQSQSSTDLAAQERAYEQQIKKTSTADLWQRLGLVRHLQNRFDSAIPAFQEAIRLTPQLWTAHLFLGIDLYRTNQFANALASLKRADKLAPREHSGRDDLDYWLGATQIALKQPLSGLQALEKLLARNPKHIDALELATQTYTELGTNLWNEVGEHYFESPAGQEVQGHALEDDGNNAGAMDAYQQSKSFNGKRPGPRLAIAQLLLKENKPAQALVALEEEMSISPDPQAFLWAGIAAAQMGKHEDAVRWLTEASKWPSTKAAAFAALAELNQAPKK